MSIWHANPKSKSRKGGRGEWFEVYCFCPVCLLWFFNLPHNFWTIDDRYLFCTYVLHTLPIKPFKLPQGEWLSDFEHHLSAKNRVLFVFFSFLPLVHRLKCFTILSFAYVSLSATSPLLCSLKVFEMVLQLIIIGRVFKIVFQFTISGRGFKMHKHTNIKHKQQN